MAQTYTDDELLKELHRVAELKSTVPTTDDIRELAKPSISTYSKRFGGIPKARQKAGMGTESGHQIRKEYVNIPDKKLLADLKRLANKLGRVPSASEVENMGNYCSDTYTDRFGSMSEAREKAGLDAEYEFTKEKQSKEKQKRICDNCGKVEWVVPSHANQKYCSNKCNGEDKRKHSTEKIRAALTVLAESNGSVPTTKEFDQHTKFSHGVFEMREELNSFSTELRDLGYQPNCPKDVPDEELLSNLKKIKDKINHPPRQSDIRSHGIVNSVGPYIQRWGSWINALEQANIEPSNTQRTMILEDELIDDYLRVKNSIGAVPSYNDVKKHGSFSPSTYENVFGSFLNAKQAAGFEPKQSTHNMPRAEDHYAWKGGTNPEYGANWRQQREKARQRDNFTCQRCGIKKEDHIDEYGTLPHVHHITPWDDFSDCENRNNLTNLVTLCASCHKKIENLPVKPQFEQTETVEK